MASCYCQDIICALVLNCIRNAYNNALLLLPVQSAGQLLLTWMACWYQLAVMPLRYADTICNFLASDILFAFAALLNSSSQATGSSLPEKVGNSTVVVSRPC